MGALLEFLTKLRIAAKNFQQIWCLLSLWYSHGSPSYRKSLSCPQRLLQFWNNSKKHFLRVSRQSFTNTVALHIRFSTPDTEGLDVLEWRRPPVAISGSQKNAVYIGLCQCCRPISECIRWTKGEKEQVDTRQYFSSWLSLRWSGKLQKQGCHPTFRKQCHKMVAYQQRRVSLSMETGHLCPMYSC